jgi:hypothetical protein
MNSSASINFQPQFAAFYRQQALDLAINQYFALDEFQRKRLAYLMEYLQGSSVLDYLEQNHLKWKARLREIPPAIQSQICRAIPKFVDFETKFHFLKYEFLARVAHWLDFLPQAQTSLPKLYSVYQQIWAANELLEAFETEWYAENIFSAEDIKSVAKAFQYLVRLKLRHSYQAVKEDIELIISELSKNDSLHTTCTYQINDLEISLNLGNLAKINPSFIHFESGFIARPDLQGNFKPFLEDFIMNELLVAQKKQGIDEINGYLEAIDWANLQAIIQNKGQNKLQVAAKFAGKGGVLNFQLQTKFLTKKEPWFLNLFRKLYLN